MRRLVLAAAALAVVAVAVLATTAWAGNGKHDDVTVIRLVEQVGAVGQTYIPAGPTSPVGDRIVWSAGIFDTNGHQVGKDVADCTVITADFTVQCLISVTLPGGQLTVQGMATGVDNVFAITGGTGAYKDARGDVRAVDTTPGVRAELTLRLVED